MLLLIFMSLRPFWCSRSLREAAQAVFPVCEAFARPTERFFPSADPSRDCPNDFPRSRSLREVARTIFHAREAFASSAGGGRPLSFGFDMFIIVSRFKLLLFSIRKDTKNSTNMFKCMPNLYNFSKILYYRAEEINKFTSFYVIFIVSGCTLLFFQ